MLTNTDIASSLKRRWWYPCKRALYRGLQSSVARQNPSSQMPDHSIDTSGVKRSLYSLTALTEVNFDFIWFLAILIRLVLWSWMPCKLIPTTWYGHSLTQIGPMCRGWILQRGQSQWVPFACDDRHKSFDKYC